MTLQQAIEQRTKCENAIAFGVQTKGNLQWAHAKLAAIQAYIAKHYPASNT